MTATLTHRGPDDAGVWKDEDVGLALGHRRLSILDLSSHGHQPMLSVDGSLVIVFNGEIYNHVDIRTKLDASGLTPQLGWRGHSDTETLLAAISAWGIERTLEASIGMFAFAVWDRRNLTLTLARDRVGEKPLYYLSHGLTFAFASELKALAALPGTRLELDAQSVESLLRYGYIPAPHSIYQSVYKLEPSTLLRIKLCGETMSVEGSTPYWRLPGLSSDDDRTDDGMEEQLHRLLLDAVRQQMVADVPLGAFLSGGIDSSLIVALMQTQSSRPVRTFTIGFPDTQFDEAPFARDVARYLGTDHTELYVTPAEAASVIPELPAIYDEPFADSSQVPTLILARLTRKHVKVSLSGDGGDELFAGYPRYQFAESLWHRTESIPRNLRPAAGFLLRALTPRMWDRVLPRSDSINGHRVHRFADVLTAPDFLTMYERLLSQWPDPRHVIRSSGKRSSENASPAWGSGPIQQMRYRDFKHYLPDDILVKVDRATMSASLESRAPFLDHRVVEFAFSLPKRMLLRDGVGKWLLRQVLHRLVPRQLFERPKSGFGMPVGQWIRGPLRHWAENLLSEESLLSSQVFDLLIVRRTWAEHLSGQHDRQAKLWPILMFQAWFLALR